jgi:predicted transcriptional regulator
MAFRSKLYRIIKHLLWEHKQLSTKQFYQKVQEYGDYSESYIRSALSRLNEDGQIAKLKRGTYALSKIAIQLKNLADLPEQKLSLHNLLAKYKPLEHTTAEEILSCVQSLPNFHNCEDNGSYKLKHKIKTDCYVTITVSARGLVTVHSHNTNTRAAFSSYEEFEMYEKVVQALLSPLELDYQKQFKYHGYDFAVDDRTIHFEDQPVQTKLFGQYLLKMYRKDSGTFRKEVRKLPTDDTVHRDDLETMITSVSGPELKNFMTVNGLAVEAGKHIKESKLINRNIQNEVTTALRSYERLAKEYDRQQALTTQEMHETAERIEKLEGMNHEIQNDIVQTHAAVATGNMNLGQLTSAVLNLNSEHQQSTEKIVNGVTNVFRDQSDSLKHEFEQQQAEIIHKLDQTEENIKTVTDVNKTVEKVTEEIRNTEKRLSEKIEKYGRRTIDHTYDEVLEGLRDLGQATAKQVAQYIDEKYTTVGPRLSELFAENRVWREREGRSYVYFINESEKDAN